jgi:DNA-binding NtrC family response regulator
MTPEDPAPRVLVVDDEESIRYVLGTYLERQDCEVITAGSSEQALKVLETFDPEVALVDIVLPGKNGLDLLSEIKQRHPDTEVVLITSQGSVETAVGAIRRGAYDYMQKPFRSLQDVWITVSRAVEKRRLTLQVRALMEACAERNRDVTEAANQLLPE